MNPVKAFTEAMDFAEQTLNQAQARILALENALYECAEYFENRADADHDETGFVPNVEMRLLQTIDEALGD